MDKDFNIDRELRFKRKYAEILNKKYGLNIAVERRQNDNKAR